MVRVDETYIHDYRAISMPITSHHIRMELPNEPKQCYPPLQDHIRHWACGIVSRSTPLHPLPSHYPDT